MVRKRLRKESVTRLNEWMELLEKSVCGRGLENEEPQATITTLDLFWFRCSCCPVALEFSSVMPQLALFLLWI